MKSSLLKRSLIAGAAVVATFATFATTAGANSVVSPHTPGNTVIVAAGSDTTQNVMGAILSTGVPVGQTWANVDAYPSSPLDIPGDANCAAFTFYNTGTTPAPSMTTPNAGQNRGIIAPNGSGAGRNMLRDFLAGTAADRGCQEIARSSSFGSGSPAAGTGEYYAFALDAVSWASASLSAPAALSPADLLKIYNCTYTDWSQVPGGTSGPIKRYLPPDTSGTTGFFKSDLLGGFDPTTVSNGSCPAVVRIGSDGAPLEENHADKIPAADWQSAILPYSSGNWVYQANNAVNPTLDHRVIAGGGYTARLGGLIMDTSTPPTGSGVANNANTAAWNTTDHVWQLNDAGLQVVQPGAPGGYPVVETNSKKVTPTPAFNGIRFVYNVIDTRSAAYAQAQGAVGFDNIASGAKSPLCSGQRATIIQSFGFSPLPAVTNAGTDLAGATCRKYVA